LRSRRLLRRHRGQGADEAPPALGAVGIVGIRPLPPDTRIVCEHIVCEH